MSDIKQFCTYCCDPYIFSDEFVGRSTRCPHCGEEINLYSWQFKRSETHFQKATVSAETHREDKIERFLPEWPGAGAGIADWLGYVFVMAFGLWICMFGIVLAFMVMTASRYHGSRMLLHFGGRWFQQA